jgi:hypothetical protein
MNDRPDALASAVPTSPDSEPLPPDTADFGSDSYGYGPVAGTYSAYEGRPLYAPYSVGRQSASSGLAWRCLKNFTSRP